eukprot:13857990-Heterocapsa_arctica.AAC.1
MLQPLRPVQRPCSPACCNRSGLTILVSSPRPFWLLRGPSGVGARGRGVRGSSRQATAGRGEDRGAQQARPSNGAQILATCAC